MYKEFENLELLMQEVAEDKSATGANRESFNRYPIRFVLFDNLNDAYNFVSSLQQQHCTIVESVSSWVDNEFKDTIITYTELVERIKQLVVTKSQTDCVISPFSELARFYDNSERFEFDALIATIKSIEANVIALTNRQRLYIPIVGLSGKMSKFIEDSQIVIWHFKSSGNQFNYRLIQTNGTTYGVRELERKYTVIDSVYSWLEIWKSNDVQKDIILTSPSIFANAKHAQPDNAFTYESCSNVFEFLTDGLKLTLPEISYKESEKEYWERFASEIDIMDFSFDSFFNNYFHISSLSDVNIFLRAWFDCTDYFEKWLLTTYYKHKFCKDDYICLVLDECSAFTNMEFFSSVLLTIFHTDNPSQHIEQRAICLTEASKREINLSDSTLRELEKYLTKLESEIGAESVMPFMSELTEIEKRITIKWFANNIIGEDSFKNHFPELYNYLKQPIIALNSNQQWIVEYIDEYKIAKVKNVYTDTVNRIINEKNNNEVTFNSWYQDFKSVNSILNKREDIDVYYWIDGLGVDWIPYINWILKHNECEGIYVNETYIARSMYPTTTEVNKPILTSLSLDKLRKKGSLDSIAHDNKFKLPYAIIEEFAAVKKAICDIISEYAGKKIAIISDHGLTALSQLKNGLNLSGVKSDHGGRAAIRKDGVNVLSTDYVFAKDEQTICALKHKSLCGKITEGQSSHGGCTPEEILVPIFIVSSHKNSMTWNAELIEYAVSAINPILKFNIKGLQSNDAPHIVYNGKQYNLSYVESDMYISDRLNLIETVTNVELIVGSNKQSFKISISIGVQEDDLFDF